MDRKILEEGGIDYADGLARCLNDSSLYERVLEKFPADKSYSKIVESLAAGDAKAAFEAAHTLKGVSANLGLKDLYDSVFVLVESLRNASDISGAEPLMPPVVSNYDRVIRALENAQ
ncbi:MAG: Hpt domain-containing protein [Lachnospiraceae bacterium]|nr:Hpt domain-containing protein [Lachnospiraceae bacterium]